MRSKAKVAAKFSSRQMARFNMAQGSAPDLRPSQLRIDPLAQPATRGERVLLAHSPDWLTGP